MRTIAGLLLTTLLTISAGCARGDWIDRTLVTVDVTGTWYGSETGPGAVMLSGDVSLELEQQGPTVKGSVRSTGGQGGIIIGPIDGTVAGDVFHFKQTNGTLEGELTVSGDEMTGRVTKAIVGSRSFSLRRVDPSSRPGPPTR